MREEGRWVDRIVGLDGVRSELAMLQTPDGHGRLELAKFHSPPSQVDNLPAPANTLGIRHIAFLVEDIDVVVAGEVIALLVGDPPPAPPALHEVRDGLIVRWIDTPAEWAHRDGALMAPARSMLKIRERSLPCGPAYIEIVSPPSSNPRRDAERLAD